MYNNSPLIFFLNIFFPIQHAYFGTRGPHWPLHHPRLPFAAQYIRRITSPVKRPRMKSEWNALRAVRRISRLRLFKAHHDPTAIYRTFTNAGHIPPTSRSRNARRPPARGEFARPVALLPRPGRGRRRRRRRSDNRTATKYMYVRFTRGRKYTLGNEVIVQRPV